MAPDFKVAPTVNGVPVLLANGSVALTANWDIGEDRRILIEAFRARDSEGIRLENSAGDLGLLIDNTGLVVIGATGMQFRSPDVAHGMTTYVSTDTYAQIIPGSTLWGGLSIEAFTDTDGISPLGFNAVFGITDPTDTLPAINFLAQKKNGTASQALAAAETVLGIDNYATRLVTLLGDGSLGLGGTPLAGGFFHVFKAAAVAGVLIERTSTFSGSDEIGILQFRYATDSLASVSAVRDGANDAAAILLSTQATGGSLTEKLRINSRGDFGFSTSDIEVSHANYGAMQLGLFGYFLYGRAGGAQNLHLTYNSYYDGTWKRRSASTASALFLQSDNVNFLTAVTGIIDSAITWVEQMRVTPLGVGIGTSTPAGTETNSKFTVEENDATSLYDAVINTGAGQAGRCYRRTGTTPSRWVEYIPAAIDGFYFYSNTANADIVRISPTNLSVRAGTTTSYPRIGGVLYSLPAGVGNVGTGTDTLLDFTLLANTLAVNGDSIRITLGVILSNSAASKALSINWGGAGLIGFSPGGGTTYRLSYQILITRTGASSQWISAFYGSSSGAGNLLQLSESRAINLAANAQFLVTGAGTNNNDLRLEQAVIEFLPA